MSYISYADTGVTRKYRYHEAMLPSDGVQRVRNVTLSRRAFHKEKEYGRVPRLLLIGV